MHGRAPRDEAQFGADLQRTQPRWTSQEPSSDTRFSSGRRVRPGWEASRLRRRGRRQGWRRPGGAKTAMLAPACRFRAVPFDYRARGNGMKVFYGWVIVAVGFVVTCIGMGAMLSLGIFLQPMTEAMGWSRTGISTAAYSTGSAWEWAHSCGARSPTASAPGPWSWPAACSSA